MIRSLLMLARTAGTLIPIPVSFTDTCPASVLSATRTRVWSRVVATIVTDTATDPD